MLYDVGTGEEAAHSAPLHPAEMAALLKQKKFTSPKADRPLVIGLYHATILSVLGGAKKLEFQESGWGPQDGVAFAKVLPFCRSVRRLLLHHNAIGDEGCVAIADAVAAGALPELERLALYANGIGDVGCRALAAAIRGGALLSKLGRLWFHSADAPNLAGEEARAELRAACEARRITLPA